MTVTNLLDLNEIKQEQVVFLRNSDILTTTVRGVTTTTEEFNGDGNNKQFTVSQSTIKNVRSVTVGGNSVTEYTDYTVDYDNTQINFVVAPEAGVDNVDITYDYGTDKIYADWPRVDLSISSYPRIAVMITSGRTDVMGIGADANINDILLTIQVWDDNLDDIDIYIKNIRNKYLQNKTGFQYLEYIEPITISSVRHEPDRGEKIDTRSIELRALFNVEDIS